MTPSGARIPVTLGNLVGGFTFVALALLATFARKPADATQPGAFAQAVES